MQDDTPELKFEQYPVVLLRDFNVFKIAAEAPLKREEYDLAEGRFAHGISIFVNKLFKTFKPYDTNGKEYLNAINLSFIKGFILEDLIHLLNRLPPETQIAYAMDEDYPGTIEDVLSRINLALHDRELLFKNLHKTATEKVDENVLKDVLRGSPYMIPRAFGIRDLVVAQLMFEFSHLEFLSKAKTPVHVDKVSSEAA